MYACIGNVTDDVQLHNRFLTGMHGCKHVDEAEVASATVEQK
jgi:hypothetical protein